MKKIALAAAVAMAFAGAAKADWVDFIAVGGGATQSPDLSNPLLSATDNEMEYGYHLGAMFGWAQSEEIALAADVMFAESDYADAFGASLQSLSFMADVMYRCDTGDFWHPYIGAGIGAVQLRVDQVGPFSGSEWALGYQGMAGISFDVDEKHAIFVGYRYQQSEDVSIKGVPDIEYASHSISIGVVFD